jgi:transcriptional regulator with XRE-family HTH domain
MKNRKGNFFRVRRDELGMTQRDIALALNMTETAVGNWEAGFSTPRPGIWDRVAAVYKVDAERIAAAVLEVTRAAAAVA